MKKLYRLFLAAAAMTAAVSCAQDLKEDMKPVAEGKAYEFTATIGADTKTVLDGMQTLWMGDEYGKEFITVMEPTRVNKFVAEGINEPTELAKFKLDEGQGIMGNAAIAVYPAGDWTCTMSDTEGIGVNVTYATTQYAAVDTYDPKGPVAVAYNADIENEKHFNFVHASALLKLKVADETDPIKSVKVTALGGETLSGPVAIASDGTNHTFTGAEGALNYVELVGQNGSALQAGATYYIAVAPAVLAQGVSVQLNGTKTYTISSEVKFERGTICNLGEFGLPVTPKPDKVQLKFNWMTMGGFPAIIDVGVTTPGYLVAAVDMKSAFADECPPALVGWYMAYSMVGDPRGWKYEVLPTDATSGVFRIYSESFNGDVTSTDIPYSGYVDNATTFTVDGTMFMEEDPISATPATELCNVYIDGITILPGSTPEGSQWTWMDQSYGWSRCFDLGVTEEGVIYFAEDYESMLKSQWDGQLPPSEDYYDASLLGKYIADSNTRFEGYTLTKTDETSGVITFVGILNHPMFGATETYYRIEYSEFTGESMKLYSPSFFTDEDGNDLAVEDADGNPVYDSEGYPIFWSGIGLTDYGEHTNWETLPVTVTLAETVLEIVMQDSGIGGM